MPVPIVSQAPGPGWADNYNACLSILDQHNHSAGNGISISQDGINLTASITTFDSLSFNGSNAYAARSVRFTPQALALGLTTDVGCVYEAGVDLYYNDGAGNQIRLTQGGSIVGTAGSITGLPSGTASASYAGGTFVWQAATNTAAKMDAGSYVLRNNTASSFGLTLNPPNAMGSDFDLYLPSVPGTKSIVTINTSGNMVGEYTVDNSTIVINGSNQIAVNAGGIGTNELSSGSVTVIKEADSGKTNQPYNLNFTATVAANALTFTLKDLASNTPSATSPVVIPFRSSTAATATYTYRSVTAANTLIVPNGATLGTISGQSHYLFLYAIDVAGVIQLGVSQMLYDEGTLNATAAITTAADANNVIYSTSTETNVPIRCIGRVYIAEAAAGVWATAPTQALSMILPTVADSQKICAIARGTVTGASHNVIQNVRLGTTVFDNCGCMGASGGIREFFTAPQAKRYRFSISVEFAYPNSLATFSQLILYKNSVSFLTLNRLAVTTNGLSGVVTLIASHDLNLAAGDVIEFVMQQQNASSVTVNTVNYFSIEEI